MSIGTRLRYARREANLSQLKAAAELGTEQSAIWRYEADQRIPSDKMLERLASLYKRSVSWFYEEDEPEDDLDQYREGPGRPPSTRWVLKRTGLTVMLSIQCNPQANPENTYYWHANVRVEEDGFIWIGGTWLQSIDDTMVTEMHPRQQAIWHARPGPARTDQAPGPGEHMQQAGRGILRTEPADGTRPQGGRGKRRSPRQGQRGKHSGSPKATIARHNRQV